MCFRPAAVEMPDPDCPECGQKIHMLPGVEMKECPNCHCDLAQYADRMAPAFPGAPGAPGMPGAPGAPKPPGAPGAPKAPGA